MTKQEIFDKVLAHLRQQRVASETASGCAYRGEQGRTCAVGCLIPDAEYTPEMEGTAIGAILENGTARFTIYQPSTTPRPVLLSLGQHAVLLADLQSAHDRTMPDCWGDTMLAWEQAMAAIAARHKLKYTPLPRQETPA